MNREQKAAAFNASGTGNTENNIFGLPFTTEESRVVLIPVPWDVTVSNHAGTSLAPAKILECSFQIDLYDPFAPNAWKTGMAMEPISEKWGNTNAWLRPQASDYIAFLEKGGDAASSGEMAALAARVNQYCHELCGEITKKTEKYLKNNQLPFIIGGDHSVPLGLIRALGKQHGSFGILQIDAHADLRKAYQGFDYSHASIMYQAMQLPQVSKLVQVGIRDWCDEEQQRALLSPERIHWHTDRDLHSRKFKGEPWESICHDIVHSLPEKVYLSFDIDGLNPAECPNTGTPVPGGLGYNEALFLLETLVNQGRTIIGADLVETGNADLDATVACRLIYRMAGMMAKTNPQAL